MWLSCISTAPKMIQKEMDQQRCTTTWPMIIAYYYYFQITSGYFLHTSCTTFFPKQGCSCPNKILLCIMDTGTHETLELGQPPPLISRYLARTHPFLIISGVSFRGGEEGHLPPLPPPPDNFLNKPCILNKPTSNILGCVLTVT